MAVLRKSQAAVEFLTNYGWALLLIVIVFFIFSYFGLLNPDRYLPDKAEIMGIYVKEFSVSENTITFLVQNTINKPIKDLQLNVLGCNEYFGASSSSVDLAEGERKLIEVKNCITSSPEAKFKSKIDITYSTSTSNPTEFTHSGTGNVRATVRDISTRIVNLTDTLGGTPLIGSGETYFISDNHGNYKIFFFSADSSEQYVYKLTGDIATLIPGLSGDSVSNYLTSDPDLFYSRTRNGAVYDAYCVDGVIATILPELSSATNLDIAFDSQNNFYAKMKDAQSRYYGFYMDGECTATPIEGLNNVFNIDYRYDSTGTWYAIAENNSNKDVYHIDLGVATLIPELENLSNVQISLSHNGNWYAYVTDSLNKRDLYLLDGGDATAVAQIQDKNDITVSWVGNAFTGNDYVFVREQTSNRTVYYKSSPDTAVLTDIPMTSANNLIWEVCTEPSGLAYINIQDNSGKYDAYHLLGEVSQPIPGLQNMISLSMTVYSDYDNCPGYYAYGIDPLGIYRAYHISNGIATEIDELQSSLGNSVVADSDNGIVYGTAKDSNGNSTLFFIEGSSATPVEGIGKGYFDLMNLNNEYWYVIFFPESGIGLEIYYVHGSEATPVKNLDDLVGEAYISTTALQENYLVSSDENGKYDIFELSGIMATPIEGLQDYDTLWEDAGIYTDASGVVYTTIIRDGNYYTYQVKN